MSLSITEIARMHKQFIYTHLNELEQQLLPSSTEDQELVRRAVFSVRNKSVIFERYVPFSGNLYTIVQDVKSAHVTIEFLQNKIYCDCPTQGICRHQLAVLLSLYQFFDSVQDWTNAWRAKKSVEMSQLAEERTPQNWHSLVQEVLKPHLQPNKRIEGYAIMTVAEMARTRLERYMPYEREWVPMFKTFIEFDIFLHIMRQNSNANFYDSNQQYYIEYYADKTEERLNKLLLELKGQTKIFAIDPFYDELQKMVRECITIKSSYSSKQLSIYLMFWQLLFASTARYEMELIAIEELDKNGEIEPMIGQPLKAFFYMVLNNMPELERLLNSIKPEMIHHYLMIAQIAINRGAFDVSSKILRAILPHLQLFMNETINASYKQQFAYKLDTMYDTVDLTEDEEMALYNSLGKYGILPFSNFLVRKQRYNEWAALHQLYPTSFSYLETCGLKEVIEAAPDVTLPLFHHFAMEELAQKTRMNYKQAVKIWKKMRAAAKKAGKSTFFENYMQVIRTDNKRMRALQEELDRANF